VIEGQLAAKEAVLKLTASKKTTTVKYNFFIIILSNNLDYYNDIFNFNFNKK
jgi:hypothetical protein